MGILVQNLEFPVFTRTTHLRFVFISMLKPELFFFFFFFSSIIYFYLCVGGCLWVWLHLCYIVHVEARGQPTGVSSLCYVGSKKWTVPRNELKPSGLAPSTFTHWAMSPALEQIFWLFKKFFHNLIVGPDFEVQIVLKDKEGYMVVFLVIFFLLSTQWLAAGPTQFLCPNSSAQGCKQLLAVLMVLTQSELWNCLCPLFLWKITKIY